jgi:hypothetical protein
MLYRVQLAWAVFELTTLVVIDNPYDHGHNSPDITGPCEIN